jgi:hypothetical protein
MVKFVFFGKDYLGIGVGWQNLAEIAQKLNIRASCSEI